MERPLQTVKLEKSGGKAKIVTFFTHGEAKEIGQARFEGGKIGFEGSKLMMSDMPLDSLDKESDKMLVVGVKEIIDKSGNAIKDLGQKVFDNLPSTDVELLVEKLMKARLGRSKKK